MTTFEIGEPKDLENPELIKFIKKELKRLNGKFDVPAFLCVYYYLKGKEKQHD